MSIWSRIANALSGDRLNRELDEEFEAHIQDAIAAGRDPEEARRAFGPLLRQREASRRVRVAGWVESLRSDLIFWRAAVEAKPGDVGGGDFVAGVGDRRVRGGIPAGGRAAVAAAAGSASGAVVWTVAAGERTSPAAIHKVDDWAYSGFRAPMRDAARGKAELIAASYTELTDVT